jgi:hypothetical protein
MNGIRSAVWVLHWVAIVATPIWWATGSSLTGGGWDTLLAMFLGVIASLFLLIGPIIGVASKRFRAERRMPAAYSVITLVAWGFGFLWPLTLKSEGDSSSGPSALAGLGIPESIVGVLAIVLLTGFALAAVAAPISVAIDSGDSPATIAETEIEPKPVEV